MSFFNGFIRLMHTLCEAVYYWWIGALKAVPILHIFPRKSLKGQIVLITGSGSGIGRLMAIKFGKLGSKIVLWDVNERLNAETKMALDELDIESFAYTIDLSDREAIYAVAERVKQEVGDPDVLVNNAGIVSGRKLFDCPDELMEKTMAVNCTSMFFTVKAFLPAMIEQRRGHIVNVASLAGVAGINGLVDYCASKFGTVGFSEALRLELIELGVPITVTTVCTYYINTGMFDGVRSYSCLFPILNPDYVVQRIVHAVLIDADELFLPWTANVVATLKGFMPARAVYAIAGFFGFNRTMETYTGRS
uniref:Short-chain dehydrogenase/reductase 3 n=1 Tax=Globodera pallida TaxID=36090 RepID=A0A183C387_GLOPA